MNQLNHERNDGKILRGRCPADKWSEDQPTMQPFPDPHKWMYRAAYRVVEVTRNGVRVSVGTGKFQTNYTYANPSALENHRGRRVVCYWNDYDPDTDAVIYTLRNGKPDKLICVASRVAEVPRFGATDEQMAAEASRKKLSAQLAVTQAKTLSPYLPRRAVLPATQVAPVGATLERVKENTRQAKRTAAHARRFTGDASELLDEEFTNTETERSVTLPSIDEIAMSPEGPGRDGNKPLMRNRMANDAPSPIGNPDGNTFTEPELNPESLLD
jgi:hypothetical protein